MISIYKLNSNSASFGKYQKWGDSRVGYNTGTNSRPGRVNAGLRLDPYPGLSRSWVRVNRVILVSWVKAKPLTRVGLDGLAELSLNFLLYKFKSFSSKFKFKL
jgi:hypothetical protein